MTFESSLATTIGFEGATSDHALDHGGLTNSGITQRTYDAWRDKMGKPRASVVNITHDEVSAVYYSEFWITAGCDHLPDDLAAVVFDMAVNSSPRMAVKILQRALHVESDGVMGPDTIQAAMQSGRDVVLRFLKARAQFIRDIVKNDPAQIEFLAGWINRLLDQAWRFA